MAINPQRPVPSVLLNVAEGIYPNRFGYICYPPSKTEQKMNERIKQLADEAGLRFTQLMSNPMVPVVDGRETDLEKFAQLIVKECAQVCLAQRDPANLNYKPSVKFAEAINQHFGVEL